MSLLLARDPGWVKIRIRDKHPGSETLRAGFSSYQHPSLVGKNYDEGGGGDSQLGSGDAGVDGVHVNGELWLLMRGQGVGGGSQLGSGDAGVDGVHVDGELWLLVLVLRHVVNGGGVARAHVRVPHHLIETELVREVFI